MKTFGIILSWAFFYVIPSVLVTAQGRPGLCGYQYSQQVVTMNGHHVTVEIYKPEGAGPFPLVLMLHGSAGAFTVASSRQPVTDNFGEKTLARNCFAVVLPHYLEAIGRKSVTAREEMAAFFPMVLTAVAALLTHAEASPWVAGKPVYLFGESFGGYLCIALALKRNEVAAVSEFSGGLPPGYTLNLHYARNHRQRRFSVLETC